MRIDFAGLIPTEAEAGVPRLHERRRGPKLAHAYAEAGFDTILVAGAGSLGLARSLSSDSALPRLTVQHRPSASPVEAADALALLDCQAASGLSVELLAEPLPGERESFVHEKDQARTDEYLVLLKRLWLNDKTIDHEGHFYSLRNASLSARRCQKTIPLIMSGRSAVAIRVAARHADLFKLGGASLAEAKDMMERVEAAAIPFGRSGRIRYTLDIKPTSDARYPQATASSIMMPPREVLELRGRPEEMALQLLDYVELGVSHFTVHGLTTADQIAAFGDDLIPLLRRTQERARHHRFEQRPERRLVRDLV